MAWPLSVDSQPTSSADVHPDPVDSLPATPRHRPQHARAQAFTPTQSHGIPAPQQDGINPETAALLHAAATHGRQDAVQLPRDAKLVSLMLHGLGIEDYEPRVVPQLLEFMHRYVLDVLGDAQVYADHAGHNSIIADDVRIAIDGRAAHCFTNPPRRELLETLAQKKNSIPLPLIPEKFGVRLPPDRHTLTSPNFQIAVKRTHPAPHAGRPHPHAQPSAGAAVPGASHPGSPAAARMARPLVVPAPNLHSQPPPTLPPMPAAKAKVDKSDDYDDEDEEEGERPEEKGSGG